MSIPLPPEPWELTATHGVTKLFPGETMDAFDERYALPADLPEQVAQLGADVDELHELTNEGRLSPDAITEAIADGSTGLASQLVVGATPLTVKNGWTYELTATAAATVTLTGPLGCQAAIVWAGSAGTVEGQAVRAGDVWVAVRLTAGWSLFPVVGGVAPPVSGTLAASAIGAAGFTLTVTGAAAGEGGALHASPFRFSTDDGVTWSAWQSSAACEVTGKAAGTAYQCQHQVRDTAGTAVSGAKITVTTTTAVPTYTTTVLHDTFTRAAVAGTGWGTPDTGPAWVGTTGDILATQEGLKVSGSGASIESGTLGTNLDVTLTLKANGAIGSQSFFVRGQEFVAWDTGMLSLGISGTKVAIPGWVSAATGGTYRVVTQGSAIWVWANSVALTLPGTPSFTKQTIAVRSYTGGALVDNVTVKVP